MIESIALLSQQGKTYPISTRTIIRILYKLLSPRLGIITRRYIDLTLPILFPISNLSDKERE